VHTGSCLCGGIRFQVEGELAPIQVCHCSQCRKAHGTPFATNMPIPASSFNLTQGRELLKQFESSPGKIRHFCGRCGSPIYSTKDTLPGVVRLRAGLLDDPLGVRPAFHFHVASKASWWRINDDLPQFPESYVPVVRK
jgi:hypothetical protein